MSEAQPICRKRTGKAEAGNSCLQTPGTCESCPDWVRPRRCVRVLKQSEDCCVSCGKNSAKRKGKSPAPILLVAGPVGLSLCMTCAKQISDRLDTMIAAIEERYGKL
jgi:hypothetical protein